ncbi:hypothetical protein DPMN_162933 [Dreissena polymorpha]|uniref:Uncharacterized protein n=1 Tax=Dreissena polymorpha TaxID=45954 RepID=A0A9D4ES83_DREPO|nr:hypothetical protein DPMN_162933 [Dreissena polymorpha]
MVTTISETGLNSMSEKAEILHLDTLGLKLSTADGSLLKYCGYIEGTLCIPSMPHIALDVPILVIKDNSLNRDCPVIVGTNVIRLMRDMVSQNDSDVIPEEWNIAIASLNVTLFAAKLSSKRPVKLGPYETVSLNCVARGVNHAVANVVTENHDPSANYSVCPRVIKMQQHGNCCKIYVKVCNMTGKPIVLKPK